MKKGLKLALVAIGVIAFAGLTVSWSLQGGEDTNRIPIRYEPGKDTKASFGDGTIQIQGNSFDRIYQLRDVHDQKTLIKQVQSYKESDSGDMVFIFGDHTTFAIINSRTNEYQRYNNLHEVPKHYRDIFIELQQDHTINTKIR